MQQTQTTIDLKATYGNALKRWEAQVDTRKRCEMDVPDAEKKLAEARGALIEAQQALKEAFRIETQRSQECDELLAAYEKSKA